MKELIERIAWAMREASESNGLELTFDACEPLARAAIDIIIASSEACGVCGCAVYKDLPTKVSR